MPEKAGETSLESIFYGILRASSDVTDPDISAYLAALVLLLANELSDPEKVIALANEAARIASPNYQKKPF